MKISLNDVQASKKNRIDFDYYIDLSSETIGCEHPFKAPVHAVGYVADNNGVMVLKADVTAEVVIACSRCLAPVKHEEAVEVSLVLSRGPESEEADDVIFLETDEADLDEILASELILNMETVVLCSEDCKGLCPKCGKNLNEGDCGCDRRELDPRLEKLRELLK
ncbi:MAG: DUF177 domain-containing protein [Clostridiaceae bacterium]|nr:DUF177 domain-containing protein [Clostridiaceae bacterium]